MPSPLSLGLIGCVVLFRCLFRSVRLLFDRLQLLIPALILSGMASVGCFFTASPQWVDVSIGLTNKLFAVFNLVLDSYERLDVFLKFGTDLVVIESIVRIFLADNTRFIGLVATRYQP